MRTGLATILAAALLVLPMIALAVEPPPPAATWRTGGLVVDRHALALHRALGLLPGPARPAISPPPV